VKWLVAVAAMAVPLTTLQAQRESDDALAPRVADNSHPGLIARGVARIYLPALTQDGQAHDSIRQ
jgi:hypothetical protein